MYYSSTVRREHWRGCLFTVCSGYTVQYSRENHATVHYPMHLSASQRVRPHLYLVHVYLCTCRRTDADPQQTTQRVCPFMSCPFIHHPKSPHGVLSKLPPPPMVRTQNPQVAHAAKMQMAQERVERRFYTTVRPARGCPRVKPVDRPGVPIELPP